MRHIFATTAILAALAVTTVIAAPGTAAAKTWQPLMYKPADSGKPSNIVFAEAVEASVRADPTGNAMIKGSPCLTPRRFLNQINDGRKDIKVTQVAELGALLRRAYVKKAQAAGYTGSYTSSRMYCDSPGSIGSGDTSDIYGRSREFHPDEDAVFLKIDGKESLFLLGDCSNLHVLPPEVDKVVVNALPCVEVDTYEGDDDQRVIIGIIRRKPTEAEMACMKYQGPGDPAPKPDEHQCPKECTMAAPALYMGRADQPTRIWSFPVRGKGLYRSWLPSSMLSPDMDAAAVYCVYRIRHGRVVAVRGQAVTAPDFRDGHTSLNLWNETPWGN